MRTSLEQEVKCPCDEGYPRSSCCKAFSRRRNGAFFSVPRAAKSASPRPRLPAGGLSRGRGGGARLSTRPRSIAPLLLSIFARFGTMFIPPFPSLGVLLQEGRSSRPKSDRAKGAGPFKVSGKSRLIAKLTLSSCRHSGRHACSKRRERERRGRVRPVVVWHSKEVSREQ